MDSDTDLNSGRFPTSSRMSSRESVVQRRISRETSIALSIIVVVFLILHTILPGNAVDPTTVGLLVLLIFIWLLPYVKEITLPGGVKIAYSLEEAKEAVNKVPFEGPAQQQASESPESPREREVWRNVLAEDANIGLAGLRIEIESRLLRLAGPQAREKFETAPGLISQLRLKEILTADEANAIRSVVRVCNQAVHAKEIAAEVVQATAELGDRVLRLLDAKLRRYGNSGG